jgi:hypothetical protein
VCSSQPNSSSDKDGGESDIQNTECTDYRIQTEVLYFVVRDVNYSYICCISSRYTVNSHSDFSYIICVVRIFF